MLDDIRSRVLSLPRRYKQAVLVGFDFLALSFALWASYCFRYDRWYLPSNIDEWAIVFSAPLIAVPIFIRMGLYRAVVRYLPERALLTIVQAMLIATVIWVVFVFLSSMAGRGVIPRSVPFMYFATGTFIVVGSRFLAKWLFLPMTTRKNAGHDAVVIYGAGETGVQIAHSLRGSYYVAAFLDDNPALHRREVAGIRIHSPDSLDRLVEDYNVTDLILSIPSLTAQRRKEIVNSASNHHLKVRALPSIADLVTGKYLVSQIKEIDIVELLGRSSVPPEPELIRDMVVGRSIMVTGAGGSIGSELCRKIARWTPQRLVLFESNEFALYQIEQELAGVQDIVVVPVLGSVTDQARVEQTLSGHNIDVVFHAAAHKHVPLVEANAIEGIKNNVFGTSIVVNAAYEFGVKHFVLISTDKAVRPTNVMGATKRWAELLVQRRAADAARENTGQRFCAVRFGNVLGSNGSVVPLFKKQIAEGGPITLTDPAMTRYFMSIQEAAELIVQAGALSQGGDVFLLDMGDPVLITDLAENMIRLAGLSVRDELNPHGDIEIVITGKRPGEKLYEELLYDASSAQATTHAKIMRAQGQAHTLNVEPDLCELEAAIANLDESKARSILFELVSKSGQSG